MVPRDTDAEELINRDTTDTLITRYHHHTFTGDSVAKYNIKYKNVANAVKPTYLNFIPVSHKISSVQHSKVGKFTEGSYMIISFPLLPSHMW